MFSIIYTIQFLKVTEPDQHIVALILNQVHVLYSKIVLYIRDRFFLVKKIQLHNTFMVPWQNWLGITKPKSAFSTTLNASN